MGLAPEDLLGPKWERLSRKMWLTNCFDPMATPAERWRMRRRRISGRERDPPRWSSAWMAWRERACFLEWPGEPAVAKRLSR